MTRTEGKRKLYFNWHLACIAVLVFAVFFFSLLGGFRFGMLFLFISSFIFFLVVAKNGSFKFGTINKIYLAFTIWCTLSVVWAVDRAYCFDVLIPLWSANFLMASIYNYCVTKEKILRVVAISIYVGVSLALLNAIKTPLGARETYYGGVNVLGFAMLSTLLLTIWMALQKKFIYLVFAPLFLFVIFITASQKVILSILIVFLIYMGLLLYKRRIKLFFKIAIISSIAVAVAAAYFQKVGDLEYAYIRTAATIETLITGERANWAAGGADGEGLRGDLVDKGIEYISQNPILGYGINNYRPLLKNDVGFETYSHNTPIEIVIGIGFFGMILYYVIFIILLLKLLKAYKKSKSSDNLYLAACLIAIAVVGQFMQLYFDAFAHFFLAIVYSYVKRQEITDGYKFLKKMQA